MKTTRIVLFLMVLSILWCADVFAHDTKLGDPVYPIHFCPGEANDPCKGTGCDIDRLYDGRYDGGHGHIDSSDDDNNNMKYDFGEESMWGYWDKGGYDAVPNKTGAGLDLKCGSGGGNGGNGGNTGVFSISVISGPGSGAPGSQLTFVVEVRRDGTAASGQTVDFSITSGHGNASLGTTITTTGSNGRAQTILTLGSSASGSYTITATSNTNLRVGLRPFRPHPHHQHTPYM